MYNPKISPRELKRHYISATEDEIQAMLKDQGAKSLDDLYEYIPKDIRMHSDPIIPEELANAELQEHMRHLAAKNKLRTSFLGDGLPYYRTPEVVPFVLGIRNLTTAYTPYQPERSQGTLTSLWVYQCALSALTGFEAINASFYDRATSLFEAIKCAQRLVDGTDTVILSASLYPSDIEVVQTLAKDTGLQILVAPIDAHKGVVDHHALEALVKKTGSKLAAIAVPQVNCLGNLEDMDWFANLADHAKVKSIAVIDPMLLAQGGLKPPVAFGAKGASIIVGEAQHLAIPPNYGGPGLGLFGIRYTAENRNDIRQTAGRLIGKGQDSKGRDCFAIVLSTREQHIRRDKATSNICSNQAYLATLVGSALLERGNDGLKQAVSHARKNALYALGQLTEIPGLKLAFPETAFFNEFVLEMPEKAAAVIAKGRDAGLHVGVDVSKRIPGSHGNHLMLSFTDMQDSHALAKLVDFFKTEFRGSRVTPMNAKTIADRYLRMGEVAIPKIPVPAIKEFYTKLGEQNVSPDDSIYPLGSCTMKYNPYINDWAATLPEFADLHPDAPEADCQGALEVIYATQEYFKAITGLAAVTTQPVAGAQGELVGIKLFQAYHHHNNDHQRDMMLIPKSAHGTNPATATMAGFSPANLLLIEADTNGQMNLEQVRTYLRDYGPRICGIMITNPNTSGILETNFKLVADLVHKVGGLVYMDGANMNAIAGWLDLGKMGVDAVHNNTHKTWSIPHGGGGPGDAIVAVSDKLVDFLPGIQVVREGSAFKRVKPKLSIGSFHRHMGNFAHKIRCYTYLRALGRQGIRRMSGVAVLSARYLYKQLSTDFPSLPVGAEKVPRMHEFILTLSKESFAKLESAGIPKAMAIPRVGKLFLDFGLHAPTVAFPEQYGLMIEPTETYSKAELDNFVGTVKTIGQIINESPEVLKTVPHFTPIDRVDEVLANKNIMLSEPLLALPNVLPNRMSPKELEKTAPKAVWDLIRKAHSAASGNA